MVYITYQYKTIICPVWNESISLKGKYIYNEDKTNAYFVNATCPVRENMHLPTGKKDFDYKHLPFCDKKNCPFLNDFPEKITF